MSNKSDGLRKRAEELLKQRKEQQKNDFINEDIDRLLEENTMYQVELEIQNETLSNAQLQLQKLKEKYLNFFEQAPNGYMIINSEMQISDCNNTLVNILGYSKSAIRNTKISDYIHPDYQDKAYLNCNKLFKDNQTASCEIKILTAEDDYKFFRLDGIIDSNEKDNKKIRVSLIDISSEYNLNEIINENRAEIAAQNEELQSQNEELIDQNIRIEKSNTSLKRLNAAVESEKNKAQKYLDIAGVLFVALDEKGDITLFNQKCEQVLGYRQDEAIGLNWFDNFVLENLRQKAKEVFHSLIDENILPVETFENAILTKNKQERIIQWHNTPLFNVQGDIIGVLSSGEDITEKRKAEQKLQRSEARLKAIFDGINDALFVHPMKTEGIASFIEVNDIACKLLGYTRDELLKLSPLDITVSNDSDIHARKDRRKKLLDGGSVLFETGHITKTGKIIPVEINSRVFYLNNNPVILSVCRDVSERKAAREELFRSKEKYQSIFETAANLITSVDENGTIVDCNSRITDVLGYNKDEVLGQSMFMLIHPDWHDKAIESLEEILKNGISLNKEYVFVKKNGEKRNIRINSSGLKDEIGKYVRTICILEDYTEERQRHNEVAGLLRASRAINESDSFEVAARIIFDECSKIIGTNSGYVALLSDDGEENEVLFLEAENLPCTVDPELPMPIRGLREIAYRDAKVVFDNDFMNSKWVKFMPDGHVSMKNVMFSPLIIEGKVVGIMGLANKESDFNDNDVRIAGAFGELAAISLRNKQSLDKLSYSEEKYKQLFQGSRDGFVMVNKEGGFIDANDSYCKMLGYTLEELKQKKDFYEITPEKWRKWENEEIWKNRLLKTNYSGVYEKEYIRKDGFVFPVELQSYAFTDSRGEIIFLWGVARDISEKKQIEDRIKISEIKHRGIFESANDAIIILDNKKIIDCNSVTIDMYGFKSKEEMLGMEPISLSPKLQTNGELSQDLIYTYINLALEGLPQRFEWLHIKTDGTNFFAEVSLSKLEIGDKNYTQAVVRDISDRILADKNLKTEKELAQKYLDIAGVLFISLNKEGKITLFNQKSEKVLGYSQDEAIGLNWFENFVPNEVRDEVKKVFTSLIDKNIPPIEEYDNSVLTKNEEEKIIHWHNTPLYDDSGSIIGLLSSGEDITQRKITEEALKESENRFNLAMLASKDGIFDWNLITNEIYYSPGWKKMLGYEYDELPNEFRIWEELTHSEDVKRSWETLKKHIDGELPRFEVEFKMKHKKGHWVDILSRAQVSRNKQGKAVRVVGTHLDITQSKKDKKELFIAKEKAVSSEKLKTAFLANMSHEIRTPMNGILGFADLLKEPELDKKDQKHFIDVISRSGERMLNIINDLIDISKVDAGQMKLKKSSTNINEQLEYQYIFFNSEAEKKGLKLSFHTTLPNVDSIIETDKEKFYAILTNLIKNAIKYTKEGSIEFGYLRKEEFIEFFVRDTGIGIDKKRQDAIFERFVQADIEDREAYEGAGIGLALAKAFVKMLGGKIWLESEPGKGSCFSFNIPYKPVHIKRDNKSSDQNFQNRRLELNVMIVEDDQFSLQHLSIILKQFSKRIITESDGSKVVDLFRNNTDIDLIMMDIKIPGKNGLQIAKEIREFDEDVVIIAQTAYALSGDKERSIEAGCNDYMTKPLNKERLKNVLYKYF